MFKNSFCTSLHIIRKVKFLSKNSISTKLYFQTIFLWKSKLSTPQHFHEFFTRKIFDNFSREIKVVKNLNIFMSFSTKSFSTIFLVKSKLSNIPTFSRVFHRIFFRNFFSGNQSCQQLKSAKPQHFH